MNVSIGNSPPGSSDPGFPVEGRVLVATAVEAERDAVLRGLRGDGRFDVVVVGVGQAAAAAGTAAALAASRYRLVVSAGIGGGFPGRAEIGSLVVASEIVAADLGAETPDGYLSIDELGFGSARIPVEAALADRLTEAIRLSGRIVRLGPALTLTTVTGTADTAVKLAKRVPGAACEGMEGFGVASAAQRFGLPALEIRAVSNAVGPRDKSAWRIGEALAALEAASNLFPEVFQ